MVNTKIRLIIFFVAKDGEVLYSQQKQHPVVDVTGDGSKVQCCKEQFCIGTWHVRMTIKANWSSEQPRGDTPRPRSGGVAMRIYPSSKVKDIQVRR